MNWFKKWINKPPPQTENDNGLLAFILIVASLMALAFLLPSADAEELSCRDEVEAAYIQGRIDSALTFRELCIKGHTFKEGTAAYRCGPTLSL
jgi:hypothetical protein